MTVYFIRAVDDPTKMKVVVTDNLPERLQALSASFENGIELLAQCDGGVEVERAFHQLLRDDWWEDEWFHLNAHAQGVIARFSPMVSGKRIWSRLRTVEALSVSPIDDDKQIAFDLVQRLMGAFGAIHFGVAQTKAHAELKAINPMWTRRRVRAIWEKKARRIDHFEIRDLTAACEAIAALRQQAGEPRRAYLPGNLGE